MTAGEAPLVHGAVLVDGAGAPAAGRPGAAPLVLAVHSGPGAGLVFPLRRGRFRIGRSGTEIVIPDAELSREHARLDVTDSAVTLVDLGSANGTTVDGRRVHGSGRLHGLLDPVRRLVDVPCFWRHAWTPGSRPLPGADVSEPLVVSNPAAHSNRAALFLAAVLPLAIGVGLAILTGMWMFLAFTAVSAVSVWCPSCRAARQRRELRAAVAAAAHEDKERRRRAAPSAGELSLRGAPAEPVPLTLCRHRARLAAARVGASRRRISGWNRRIPASGRRRSA